ncbi:hypothetical protein [Roseibium sp.]|uniref:hypothetical protein n=1 Tax=Roseibium sp. TaxID=1936156 RepID=UPI003A96AE94
MFKINVLSSILVAASVAAVPVTALAEGSAFRSLDRSQNDLTFLKPGHTVAAPIEQARRSYVTPGYVSRDGGSGGPLIQVGESAPVSAIVKSAPKRRDGYIRIRGGNSIERKIGG